MVNFDRCDVKIGRDCLQLLGGDPPALFPSRATGRNAGAASYAIILGAKPAPMLIARLPDPLSARPFALFPSRATQGNGIAYKSFRSRTGFARTHPDCLIHMPKTALLRSVYPECAATPPVLTFDPSKSYICVHRVSDYDA